MQSPVQLVCPLHGDPLQARAASEFACPRGCLYPCVAGIPRFVSSDNYASAFGSQWKAFRKTQLDSHTGTSITRDRLSRCLGGPLEALRGKLVLEAGCGAGRFTELLLEAGARVFACDLSEAVEANRENCGDLPGYFVCQADVARLPVAPGQFDCVVCLGVIQHTPDPDATIAALARQLRPGGLLVIDHYTGVIQLRPTQDALRRFLLKRKPGFTLAFCSALVNVLWPLHRLGWRARATRNPLAATLRGWFLRASPILDYQYAYPELPDRLLKSWAILDTHDALTDYYKHTRTADEIARSLAAAGLVDVVATYGGNGVEARARSVARDQSLVSS